MKTSTIFLSLWIVKVALLAGRPSLAQDTATLTFIESPSPAGVITGYMKADDRWGALLAGGRTVYSNDTFTVKSRGRKYIWKVLEVTNGRARLARAETSPASPFSTPPDCKPNFGEFVTLLDKGSRAYKDASTQVQKDQVMSSLREDAKQWCSQHPRLCVKGYLADLIMTGETNALLRIKDVDCGNFKPNLSTTLYIHSLFEAQIPILHEQALPLKKGDQVILCGRPIFISGSDKLPLVDGLAQLTCLTSFRMISNTASIGSLALEDIRYDIFDPKSDSIQALPTNLAHNEQAANTWNSSAETRSPMQPAQVFTSSPPASVTNLPTNPANQNVNSAERITLKLCSSRSRIHLGNSFILTIGIEGADRAIDTPDLSAFLPSDVLFLGQHSNSRSSTIIINGRLTRQSFEGRVFSYKITPRLPGPFRTGPVCVKVAGRTYTDPGITVEVTEGPGS